jgi:hypothetical protein
MPPAGADPPVSAAATTRLCHSASAAVSRITAYETGLITGGTTHHDQPLLTKRPDPV